MLEILNLKTDRAMNEKLKSRKLWVTVVGTALASLAQSLGYPEVAKLILGFVGTYNVGQGMADLGHRKDS